MSRPRNVFFPPILQVLEEGEHQHYYTEGVSNVITWVDLDFVQRSAPPKKTRRPHTPLSHLMKTIDLRDSDTMKDACESFSYIVCFPEDDKGTNNLDNMDKAIHTEKTVKTRVSFQNLSAGSLWKTLNNIISGLTNAAKRIPPAKTTHTESNFRRFHH